MSSLTEAELHDQLVKTEDALADMRADLLELSGMELDIGGKEATLAAAIASDKRISKVVLRPAPFGVWHFAVTYNTDWLGIKPDGLTGLYTFETAEKLYVGLHNRVHDTGTDFLKLIVAPARESAE